MRTGCDGCKFNVGTKDKPKCDDPIEYVDEETGDDVCRYREGAVAKVHNTTSKVVNK